MGRMREHETTPLLHPDQVSVQASRLTNGKLQITEYPVRLLLSCCMSVPAYKYCSHNSRIALVVITARLIALRQRCLMKRIFPSTHDYLAIQDLDLADMLSSGTMKADSVLKNGPSVTASSDEHNSQASIAANEEHNLSFSDAIRRYPAAVFWSLFFSLGVIMAVRTIFLSRRTYLMRIGI